jgi:DNA modification methylase
MSRFYYDADGIRLYHGDCIDLSIECDLLVTDPPYGVEYASAYESRTLWGDIAGDGRSTDDRAAIVERLKLAIAGLKVKRHVYVFGRIDLTSLPLIGHCELIWDKELLGLGDLSSPWAPQHEPITFAVHIPPTSEPGKGRGNLTARLRRGSILRSVRANATGIVNHPTEKPIEILRQMIESSSVIGETVYDPFAGSGSTLIAAAIEGRKAVGCEIEERYCEIAARRFATEIPRLLIASDL